MEIPEYYLINMILGIKFSAPKKSSLVTWLINMPCFSVEFGMRMVDDWTRTSRLVGYVFSSLEGNNPGGDWVAGLGERPEVYRNHRNLRVPRHANPTRNRWPYKLLKDDPGGSYTLNKGGYFLEEMALGGGYT